MTTLENCKIIRLPQMKQPEGSLTPIEGSQDIPFEIRRVFYLYDVPGGAERGAHAHINQQQFMISVMGSFNVILKDGKDTKKYHMNRGFNGLYIPNMIWGEVEEFSSGGICVVLSSIKFDENDYIRDYDEFIRMKYCANSIS